MKHHERRREIGRMLVDIAKYILTVSLIGGILTEKITFPLGMATVVAAFIVLLAAFFTLPPDKEE